jgi:DNA-directed RNA polymerase II subunit RPB7
VNEEILQQLRLKVEGRCHGKYGYTVLVTDIVKYGKGRIHEDTGDAEFPVEYNALVFRPFRAEVLSAEVVEVNSQGFFVQAGPCQIFVSSQCMPDDMKYANDSGVHKYTTDDDEISLENGATVRVKVLGIRHAKDSMVSCHVGQWEKAGRSEEARGGGGRGTTWRSVDDCIFVLMWHVTNLGMNACLSVSVSLSLQTIVGTIKEDYLGVI